MCLLSNIILCIIHFILELDNYRELMYLYNQAFGKMQSITQICCSIMNKQL